MFDSIRSHRKWLMVFLLLFIFPSFVATGIYGYNRFISGDQAVARIGGESITPQQFEAAHRERVQQLRQALEQNFDPRMFDTPAAREASLRALLGERALRLEAVSENVAIGESRLRQIISEVPAFQQDGKFSYERYKTLLTAQGLSEAGFEYRVREDVARQTLLDAVARSALLPTTVADRLTRLLEETRTVRERRFRPEDFLAQASVNDDAVKAFYEANRTQFETKESARVEYAALTLDDVAQQIVVPPAELQSYYEQNKASFSEPEQRRASHVLLTIGEGGSAKDKSAALKLAQEILAKVRAKPDDFAKLAQQYSKDPGSAAQGGDLGFFGRNMMVKAFEDAAFALKPGQISDIVETEFGLHIIRVTEVKGGAVKSFDQVKDQIELSYRRQQAQKKFAEAAEQFTNLVYEQADSLKPAADKLNLKINVVDNVTRDGLPQGAPAAALLTPSVVQALFTDDALNKKRNSAAIEAGANTLVSARIVEHRPARLRPFDEVKASIRDRLLGDDATRLAREAATKAVASLSASPSEAGFSAPRTVGRLRAEGLSAAAINAVMRVAADKLPSFVSAELDGGVQGVFWVIEAKTPDSANGPQREQLVRSAERQVATADDLAYIEALKRKYKAEIISGEVATTARSSEDKGAEKK